MELVAAKHEKSVRVLHKILPGVGVTRLSQSPNTNHIREETFRCEVLFSPIARV
jgi:hypothetical protein